MNTKGILDVIHGVNANGQAALAEVQAYWTACDRDVAAKQRAVATDPTLTDEGKRAAIAAVRRPIHEKVHHLATKALEALDNFRAVEPQLTREAYLATFRFTTSKDQATEDAAAMRAMMSSERMHGEERFHAFEGALREREFANATTLLRDLTRDAAKPDATDADRQRAADAAKLLGATPLPEYDRACEAFAGIRRSAGMIRVMHDRIAGIDVQPLRVLSAARGTGPYSTLAPLPTDDEKALGERLSDARSAA